MNLIFFGSSRGFFFETLLEELVDSAFPLGLAFGEEGGVVFVFALDEEVFLTPFAFGDDGGEVSFFLDTSFVRCFDLTILGGASILLDALLPLESPDVSVEDPSDESSDDEEEEEEESEDDDDDDAVFIGSFLSTSSSLSDASSA